MVEYIKLSETSALVLRFLQDQVYHSQAVKDYLARLDLSAGKEMQDACDAIWPHYSEVIINRKHTILKYIEEALAENPSLQIISGAAGLDPLGLELTQRHKGLTVYEIDREQMPLKAALISAPELCFIPGDLGDTAPLIDRLTKAGWQQDKPTFLIMEGIGYYLTPVILKNFVTAISPQYVVFDHLRETGMTQEANEIITRILGVIENYIEMDKMIRYDASSLSALLDMRIAKHASLHAIEYQRTGQNVYFPSEDFGWLDITVFEPEH